MRWSYIDTRVSGSPILQDSKLVGAVTHVLVNDPTMGCGIFIENMLDAVAQNTLPRGRVDFCEAKRRVRNGEMFDTGKV